MLECSQAVRVMVDGVESEVRIEGRNVVFMELKALIEFEAY